MKRFGKGLFIAVGIWLIIALLFPGRPSAKGRAIVAAMKNQVSQIQGREFTQPELEAAIASLKLDWDLNTFTPEVTFTGATDWSVTLVPEKRNTFLNPQHIALRILLLEFTCMEYPDITFDSGNDLHNNHKHGTGEELARP